MLASSIIAWRRNTLACCNASSGADAWANAAVHCGCNSANSFSPTWPASRQRSRNWCTMRANPRQSSSRAVVLSPAQALSSSIRASRCARCCAASALTFSIQASTTLCASLQASSKRFHNAWLGTPPWSVCFHCSRSLRSDSCILRPPIACPGGRFSRPSAAATNSRRNWSARQRCQPSSSLAATRAVCAWCSSASSIARPCSLSAWRSAAAAPALALPWPCAISFSSVAST